VVEVLLLAVALSMDAFAVAIGLGAKQGDHLRALAIRAALWFGLFQGLMPLIGYVGGRGVLGWIDSYAPWVAFALLLLIGGKMIFESFSEGIEEDITLLTNRVMLMLALATSIDAMAAGFSLTLLDVNAWLACLIIALTTAIFSYAGVFVGNKSGTWLESRADMLGGIVLIMIGFKIVLQ